VRLDKDREGACKNRNRLLFEANQEFVAFLDDDDVLYPEHIEELYDLLIKENADVAYSLPKVLSGEYEIPLDCVFGGMKDFSFNPDTLLERNFIPVTVVARRKKLVDAGGFQHLKGYYGEDHGLWLKLLYAGAKFVHLPKVTWEYRWWGTGSPGVLGNTSGLPERW
jgi:glycosyltransferase involved in cell wall biosynthesis